MKNLLILILTVALFSCSEDVKKYPIVCDVTVVKYKDGTLFSSKRELQNHYTEWTAEQFSEMMTGNHTLKVAEVNWQYITSYVCVDFTPSKKLTK
jgi:hypothetical protein